MLFVLVAGLSLQVTFSDYPLKRRLFCFVDNNEVIRIDRITSRNEAVYGRLAINIPLSSINPKAHLLVENISWNIMGPDLQRLN